MTSLCMETTTPYKMENFRRFISYSIPFRDKIIHLSTGIRAFFYQ